MISKDIHKQIDEIINGMICSKDFVCYKSGYKDLCRAKDIELEKYVICLETNPFDCKFSIYYGEVFFCNCSLRVLIAKRLKR